MVKERDAPWPAGAWKKDLAEAVTDVAELLRLLDLEDRSPTATPSALRGFPLRVPRAFDQPIRPGDPGDPLLRQVMPLVDEDEQAPGFTADPVGPRRPRSIPAPQVPRPRPGDGDRRLRGPMPLLLPPALPVWRWHAVSGRPIRYAGCRCEIPVVLSGGDPMTHPRRFSRGARAGVGGGAVGAAAADSHDCRSFCRRGWTACVRGSVQPEVPVVVEGTPTTRRDLTTSTCTGRTRRQPA